MTNKKQVLIIIDIQNDYFDNGKMPLVGSIDAADKAASILEYFRKHQLPVIFIQHINPKGAPFFELDTEGVEIHKSLKPLVEEKIVIKNYPNSFIETNLQETLLQYNISDLVICGMMTSMCVDATTRAAKDLGYNCTVIADACAAPNLGFDGRIVDGSDVSAAFIAALGMYYATVKKADAFIA